ncbi:Conserved_hypothetical protein [Hexamita inflata]|uniref:Uncharacterized protein n=1 Tax=Hexamita inflata TaxID=28002 RepID=A0ABP1HZC2_9EUKA
MNTAVMFRDLLATTIPQSKYPQIQKLGGNSNFTKLQNFILNKTAEKSEYELNLKRIHLQQLRKNSVSLKLNANQDQLLEQKKSLCEQISTSHPLLETGQLLSSKMAQQSMQLPNIDLQAKRLATSVFYENLSEHLLKQQIELLNKEQAQIFQLVNQIKNTTAMQFELKKLQMDQPFESFTFDFRTNLIPCYKKVALLLSKTNQLKQEVFHHFKQHVEYDLKAEIAPSLSFSQLITQSTALKQSANFYDFLTFTEQELQDVPKQQRISFIRSYQFAFRKIIEFVHYQTAIVKPNHEIVSNLERLIINNESRLNSSLILVSDKMRQFQEKIRLAGGIIAQFQSNRVVQDVSIMNQKLEIQSTELFNQIQVYLLNKNVDFKTLLQVEAKYSPVNTQEYLNISQDYFANKQQWLRFFQTDLERGIENVNVLCYNKIQDIEHKQKLELDKLINEIERIEAGHEIQIQNLNAMQEEDIEEESEEEIINANDRMFTYNLPKLKQRYEAVQFEQE